MTEKKLSLRNPVYFYGVGLRTCQAMHEPRTTFSKKSDACTRKMESGRNLFMYEKNESEKGVTMRKR